MNWKLYPNFTAGELRCICGCGRADMDPDFMARLQELREAFGAPMPVTPKGGFRCSDQNWAVGGAPLSFHLIGHAVDVAVMDGASRWRLVQIAMDTTMSGIGVGKTFVHLDDRAGVSHEVMDGRPNGRMMWGY